MLSLEPTSAPLGHRLYSRLFDLILDDVTRDRIVWPDAPSGGALSVPVADVLEDAPLQLRVDSLSFSIDATPERLDIGAVIEGRQFLLARAYFSFDPGDGGRGRSGVSVGQANLNVADGGVSWQAYLGALSSLAGAIAQDAGLPAP